MKTLFVPIPVFFLTVSLAGGITYPYEAPVQRQALIRTKYTAIRPGMNAKEVIEVLKPPDKTTPLYEPKVKDPRTIGTTMWYLISQLKEQGSENEIKRVAVAIRLNLKGRVTRIDPINL